MQSHESQSKEEIEYKGKELRQNLEKRMEDVRAGRIHPGKDWCFDFTDAVEKFIPIGSKFPEAESILVAAGFKVGQPHKGPGLPNQIAQHTVIGQLDLTSPMPFSPVEIVSVELFPPFPDPLSRIVKIDAGFCRRFL